MFLLFNVALSCVFIILGGRCSGDPRQPYRKKQKQQPVIEHANWTGVDLFFFVTPAELVFFYSPIFVKVHEQKQMSAWRVQSCAWMHLCLPVSRSVLRKILWCYVCDLSVTPYVQAVSLFIEVGRRENFQMAK